MPPPQRSAPRGAQIGCLTALDPLPSNPLAPLPQYNLPPFEERIDKTADRGAVIEHFDEGSVQMSMAADVALLGAYDEVIRDLELYLLHEVRQDHRHEFSLLRSIPG